LNSFRWIAPLLLCFFIGVHRINGDYYGFDSTLSVTMEWLDFGLIGSVVPLPKLPAQFKKLLGDFRSWVL
jgi:hypothetical protein